MLRFDNGGLLVETTTELPTPQPGRVTLDLETTSGHRQLTSLNPWHHCGIAGIALTYDKEAWYVPVNGDLPWVTIKFWLQQVLNQTRAWINHNIKYDAHVLINHGLRVTCELIDTLTLAKIIDSDRLMRGGYGLDALCKTWLGEESGKQGRRKDAYLKGCKSKDYGCVPIDIMGEYACQDVLITRRLYRYIQEKMPEQCEGVRDTEIALTSTLVNMEQRGIVVDLPRVKQVQLAALTSMVQTEQNIHEKVGFPIRPHVNADCFDLLCNHHGLPILGYTKDNNPSFDADILKSYLRYPQVVESTK